MGAGLLTADGEGDDVDAGDVPAAGVVGVSKPGEGDAGTDDAGVAMVAGVAAAALDPRTRLSNSVICDLIASLSVKALADMKWNV